MKQKTKKWGFLTAAVVLALGTAAFPQGVQASTALSGTTYAGSAQATGESSTAIGDNAKATSKFAIAIGDTATAGGTDPTEAQKELGDFNGGTIAIGHAASAQGNYSTALGYNATTTSTGRKGIAIGNQVTVSGDSAIGIGQHMEVGGEETVAIGYGVTTATVTGYDQTTGKYTTTAYNGATGVGSRSMAIADFSTALGYGTYATTEGSVAIGSRAKIGFWYDATGSGTASYLGGGNASVAQGYYSNAVGDYSVAIGAASMAGGFLGQDQSTYAITVSSYAVAMGYGAVAAANNSTALGHSATVTVLSNYSTAIGYEAYVGRSPTDPVLYANAIGYEAQAQQNGAFAIGYQALAATAQQNENVTTGAKDDNSKTLVSTVSFGHTEDDIPYVYDSTTQTYKQGDAYGSAALSRLTNIAVGKADTDAVNFSQIKITAPTSGTTHLVSSVKEDGTLNEKGTIGANLKNLDSSVVALEQLVSVDDAKSKISVGAGSDVTEATEVSIKGNENRKLTGVAYDTDSHSAAAYGQLIKAGTYKATGTDKTEAQTVTLAYNDESSSANKVVISLDATGAVAEGDKRLVNGDTVYQAIKDATKTYLGSDTVTVSTDNKISVKNMAMGSSGTTGAKATGGNSFAIGDESNASGRNSIALGAGAVAAENTEATTDPGSTGSSIAIGTSAKATGNGTVVMGAAAAASGEEGIAIGSEANSTGYEAMALGSGANAKANATTAVGGVSNAAGLASSAVGYQSTASNQLASAFGYSSNALNDGALALGAVTVASGYAAAAIGYGSTAMGDYSMALGTAAKTIDKAKYSLALGINAETHSTQAVAIGYQAVAEDANTVSFGHKKGDKYVTGYQEDGTVIYALYDSDSYAKLTNVAYADTTEYHSAAAYGQLISSASYSNGVLTLKRADESLDAITVKISTSGGGGTGTEYDAGNGIEITSSTTGGNPTIAVKVSGDDLQATSAGLSVNKNGKVEAGNTGIVTGGTVYEALKDMDNQVSELSDDINKVGAGAAALAALRPEAFDPSDKWSFAVGYGHYKNANAGAIGAFFKPNADTTLSIGGTIGNGDPLMNAGVSFKLGSRSAKLPQNASNPQLVQEVNTLRAQNASQQQEITALRADNQRMKQQIEMILSKLDMSGKVSRTAR